jgi:hypothetical protein
MGRIAAEEPTGALLGLGKVFLNLVPLKKQNYDAVIVGNAQI